MFPKVVTIQDLTNAYKSGTLTPIKYISKILDELEHVNPKVNAVAKFLPRNWILSQAKESTKRYKNGTSLGPFDGVPITVKDLESNATKGVPLTMGLVLPEANIIPDKSKPHINILQKQGAIVICSTTSCELGFKGTTSSLAYGITRSPHDLTLTSGGSSGGAGALTACGIGMINLGSDGGGSIRIPANCNGVIGFKPTYGIGNEYPTFPYLSHVGPLTRNMDNVRLYMYEMIKGDNKYLWKQMNKQLLGIMESKLKNRDFIKSGVNGLKIGITTTLDGIFPKKYIDKNILKCFYNAVDYFKTLGCDIVDLDDRNCKYKLGFNEMKKEFFNCSAILWRVSFSTKFGPYINDNNKHLIDPILVKVAEKGKDIKGSELMNAILTRDKIREIMDKYFENFDLLLTPTMPVLPPKALSYDIDYISQAKQVNSMSFYTFLCNFTGLPALSINCGNITRKNGITPIGLQIIGNLYNDHNIIKAGFIFENKFKCLVSKL